MAIIIQKEKGIFSLHTNHTTYQMMADEYGSLLHLYYGARTDGEMDYLIQMADRGFAGNAYDVNPKRIYSFDTLPQEFPQWGTGDYRNSALVVEWPNGTEGTDLRYESHVVSEGKYALPNLPAVYADEEEAQTLEITLKDRYSDLRVVLLYGVLPKLDIITRAVRVENRTGDTVTLKRVLSASFDQPAGDYDVISFVGRHALERKMTRHTLANGSYVIGSRRGTSSHQYNPLMILTEKNTDERQGAAWAMEFVYSGGFTAAAEKDQLNQTRLQMGLSEDQFAYPLRSGDTFTAPEVILSMSTTGLADLSNNLQRTLRTHVARGWWRDRVRPVLLNSWEACYFDFDGQKIIDLAKEAKRIGVDMLVLDDGWFGKRNDDNSGLGDWFVNEKKLGGSLKEVSRAVHEQDLLFGIWVEPEMVNEDSDLFRAHPDWALRIPGRDPIMSRNQLVLDFSRPEIVDDIYEKICAVIDETEVDYVKWDYNRSMSDLYSHGSAVPGAVLYDYMTGLYSFLDRLNERYPKLLIEGCSGGGGRFDAGMLYYTPQIWTSDNTDAIDRLTIQYGTSFGYPTSMVGAHVSAVPNEQCGRITSMKTRAVTAMSGTFGYEMDPAKLSDAEVEEIHAVNRTRRTYEELLLKGDYYRLSNPDEDAYAAWMHVSEDKTEALLSIVMLETHGNMTPNYVRLNGLKADAMYRLEEVGADETRENAAHLGDGIYPANALMQFGIPAPIKMGEYPAYQYHLTLV